jgi:hypothetical protein
MILSSYEDQLPSVSCLLAAKMEMLVVNIGGR